MKHDNRTMGQLLLAIPRTMGDPESSPEDLEQLAKSITARSRQLVKDLEAIAAGRRNGHVREAVKRPA